MAANSTPTASTVNASAPTRRRRARVRALCCTALPSRSPRAPSTRPSARRSAVRAREDEAARLAGRERFAGGPDRFAGGLDALGPGARFGGVERPAAGFVALARGAGGRVAVAVDVGRRDEGGRDGVRRGAIYALRAPRASAARPGNSAALPRS